MWDLMRKKGRRLIPAVLLLLLILFLTSFMLYAQGAPSDDETACLLGDANESGEADIFDVTYIQRHITLLSDMEINKLAADVNGNKQVDILDAALIQQYLADNADSCYIGEDMRELYTPRAVRCASVGSEVAELRWSAPKMPADGYEIYCRPSDDSEEERFLAAVHGQAFEAEGLSPNTEYIFTVRAFRSIGGRMFRMENGAELSQMTIAPPVQELSLILTVDRAYMTWEASDGADGYLICRDTGDGPVLVSETRDTEYRDSDIIGNAKYRYSVRAVKLVNGKKTVSSEASFAEGWSSPSKPGFTVKRENGMFTLDWSETKGADKYEILMQTPGEEEMKAVALTEALTYSISALDTPEAIFAVRSVKYADGKEYRSEYRKRSCSQYKPTGTIGSFGDSIAFALGSCQFGYAEIIGYDHRLKVDNRGVNSATLSITDGRHCICDDVLDSVKNDSTYDHILIDGGINDYYNSRPLGEVTQDGASSFDRMTVCGGLETIFTHIRSKAPSAKTVFVLVHDVSETAQKKNELGLTFLDYSAAIKGVCEKYGVEIADCGSRLKTGDVEASRQYTYLRYGIYPDGDGLHPNEAGYRRFYVPVIEEKLFGE